MSVSLQSDQQLGRENEVKIQEMERFLRLATFEKAR